MADATASSGAHDDSGALRQGTADPSTGPGAVEVSDAVGAESGPATRTGGRAGRNLPAAIAVGVVLLGALIFSLGWWNPGFVILATVLIMVATVEVHRALIRGGMTSSLWTIQVGTIAMMGGAYLIERRTQFPGPTYLLVCIGVMVLLAFLTRLPKGPKGFVKDTAASMFIICYLPLMGAFAAMLMAFDDGPARVLMWLLVVVGSDLGGYVAGVLFGKHPMAPTISPRKTWEGFLGSAVLGSALGIATGTWLLGVPWWLGLVISLVLVVSAVVGDLVESLIKRDLGVKDMGSFLPGHGGVMDRLDSILLSAPAAWILMFFFVPGV